MDGTIYLGNRLFDFTLPFFAFLRENGARYMFLTNNSSKNSELYLKKLHGMGIQVGAEDLITSTHATARYLLATYGQQPIYASGTTAFCDELSALGLNLISAEQSLAENSCPVP